MTANDGAYRDPLAGLRARVDGLMQEVREREERMTDALWLYLPDQLASALKDKRALLTQAELALPEAERVLLEYRDDLDRALALAPDIEAKQLELPDEAPKPVPHVTIRPLILFYDSDIYRETVESLERTLSHSLDRLSEDNSLDQTNRDTWLARFEAHGAPFALLAQLGSTMGENAAQVFVTITTSIARATPNLSLRLQTGLDSIGKLLRLVRDSEVGDEAFDDLFVIDAEPSAAKSLLTKPVRKTLLDVARFDVPSLQVGEGIASIFFRFEPTERLVRAATLALSLIRKAPNSIELVR